MKYYIQFVRPDGNKDQPREVSADIYLTAVFEKYYDNPRTRVMKTRNSEKLLVYV